MVEEGGKWYDEGRKKVEMPRSVPKNLSVRLPIAQIVQEVGEKYRLREVQRAFLSIRLLFATDADACRSLEITTSSVVAWRKSPGFAAAEREFYTRQAQAAEEAVNQLLMKAVVKADELMNATRMVFNSRGEGYEMPDHMARAKGIELVMRWAGKWSDTVKHEVDPAYTQAITEFAELVRQKQLPAGEVVDVTAMEVP